MKDQEEKKIEEIRIELQPPVDNITILNMYMIYWYAKYGQILIFDKAGRWEYNFFKNLFKAVTAVWNFKIDFVEVFW